MATKSRSFRIHLIFCIFLELITIILAQDKSVQSPLIKPYHISLLENEVLDHTFYRLQKRSAPPVKKASFASEKKVLSKAETTVQPKVQKNDVKYKVENETVDANETISSIVDTTATNTTVSEATYNVTSSLSNATVTSEANASNTSTLAMNSTTQTEHIITPLYTQPLSSTTSSPTTTSSTTQSPDPGLPTKPSSITNTTLDHHTYYNSTLFLDAKKAMSFWVDFDALPQDRVVIHRMLSDSHRKAATVTLTFDFPFYGHPLRNITIATGGFVYMGDYMHSWLAATQYIAPLMANFDTSLSNQSTVRYFDNGTAFVIEWHGVTLQDEKRGGNFTFQTTLLNNGNIIFVYDTIPVSVKDIGDVAHPVKVGLSDAYVIDRVIYFIRRKTIYEYHRIDMKREGIGNHTAIYFNALTTCMSFHDCHSCMVAEVGLECVWCESAKRCSDGLDRLRQDWLHSKCDVQKHSVNCSLLPPPDVNPYVQPLTDLPHYKPYTPKTTPDSSYETPTNEIYNQDNGASSSARVAEDSSSFGVGGVVAVLLILAMVLGGLMWVGYAYKNPHSSSGQLLIRYRPSTWRLRRGEARYTAASVHM